MNLNEDIPGVPRQKWPLYWHRGQPVRENLNRINGWILYYADRTADRYNIDEASVLVPDVYHRDRLGVDLRAEGWEKFNEAFDVVFTNPFGTRYCVEYTFYRHAAVPYRLEVMMLGMDDHEVPGFSPLHTALLGPDGAVVKGAGVRQYPIPHLSFKVPDRLGYGIAVRDLQDRGCVHAMTCQSTYGHFGYYLGNDAARQVYVKPRFNARDAG